MEPLESSTLLLMSILARNKEKEKINNFSYIPRTHSTLGEKNSFLSMMKIFILN